MSKLEGVTLKKIHFYRVRSQKFGHILFVGFSEDFTRIFEEMRPKNAQFRGISAHIKSKHTNNLSDSFSSFKKKCCLFFGFFSVYKLLVQNDQNSRNHRSKNIISC